MLGVLYSNLCRAPAVLAEDFHVFSPATHRVVPRLDHVLDPPSPYLCTKLNGVMSHKTAIFIGHNIVSVSLSEARILRYFVIHLRGHTLKMEAVDSSEILITLYQTTWCSSHKILILIGLDRFSLSHSLSLKLTR